MMQTTPPPPKGGGVFYLPVICRDALCGRFAHTAYREKNANYRGMILLYSPAPVRARTDALCAVCGLRRDASKRRPPGNRQTPFL